MSTNPAWRGERRIRVALEWRERTVRVAGMTALEGPAIQRVSLDAAFVARVLIGSSTVLLQSFDDPLLVRGTARPGEIGHSFARKDSAVIQVDVPVSAEGLTGEIAIRIADLSKVPGRPTDPVLVERLLDRPPRTVRNVASIAHEQLVAHPDWASLQLPGVPATPPTGRFEIFVDRAGKYRWRLRRPDGQITAASGQGYRTRAECESDLRWIREGGAHAPVQSLDLE